MNPSGTYTIRYEGQPYTPNDESVDNVKYVEDDKFQYCKNRIAVAFFWAMCELTDLTAHAAQSISKIGMNSQKRT